MHSIEQIRSGELNGAKRFSLNAGLSEFPNEIYRLADSLEILDMSHNKISSLPDDFSRLKKLKAAFFSSNLFDEIPSVLAQCPNLDIYGFRDNQIKTIVPKVLPDNLRWLILTGNRLEHIPEGMGRLSKLQKCMLAGNRLTHLPEDMQNCSSLELLRIASNQLTELPKWLLTMPQLTSLAYAGNPFYQTPTPSQVTPIDWNKLSIGQELGRGASGIIYQAQWLEPNNAVHTKSVAVKMFKGTMTSDGSPLDERNACVLAGQHPNLVPLLGRIVNHPESSDGLVLGLIPASFKDLGGPPSLISCTRDTYPENTNFNLKQILTIATGLASVANHLHNQGILHGDFYPHNTLISETGDCLLADFGAASYYDRQNHSLAFALERMEVRAFGCCLDDMLTRCQALNDVGQQQIDNLIELQQRCMHTQIVERPNFDEVLIALSECIRGQAFLN